MGLDAAKRAAEVQRGTRPFEDGCRTGCAQNTIGSAARVNQVTSQIQDADRRLDELQSRLGSASGAEG